MNLCQCGCGQEVIKKDYGYIPKYIKGHIKRSEETINKLSESHKGHIHSEETRRKMSIAKKGKNKSEETRKKMSIGMKNRIVSDETRKKMRMLNIGKIHSEETRRKISDGNKGKIVSKETRNKMKGRKASLETRLRISRSKIGEKNPSWKGGTSTDIYCPIFSNKEFRSLIYERDSNNCQLCGCSKHLSYKLFGRKLVIHHIDHNKKNCDLRNCILVCSRCNIHVEKTSLRKFYEIKLKLNIWNKYKGV